MQKTFGREVANVFLRVFAVILTFILILGIIDAWYNYDGVSDGVCNVAVMPIEGVIMPFNSYESFADMPLVTTPTSVRDFIKQAEEDTFIKGIMFEINSPGGTPVASEQISKMIRQSSLPTVSLIGDIGASGGYLIATGAKRILASAMSDVGSIGVTMSYVENSKKNEEDGVTFVQLSSGKFKDAGNPEKPLTEEERKLFEADLDVVHDEFVRQVAEMRGKTVEEIQVLADGSSMPGSKALERGLIDRIGGRDEAREEFANLLGIGTDEVVFCEYTGNLLPF